MAMQCTVIVLATLCWRAMSFPSRPPSGACQSMDPIGHMKNGAKAQELGFRISTETDIVAGGDTLEITVSGNMAIKGIFIQVRDASGDNIVGVFEAPNAVGFQLLDCLGVNGGAFGHSNSDDKGLSVIAMWRAPDMCDGTYTIRATVVVVFNTFQTGLSHQITCTSGTPGTTAAIASPEPITAIALPAQTTATPPTTMTFAPPIKPMAPVVLTEAKSLSSSTVSSSISPTEITALAPPSMTSSRKPIALKRRCVFSNYTEVPDKYRTSFEGANLIGWTNAESRRPFFGYYVNSYPFFRWGRPPGRSRRRVNHAQQWRRSKPFNSFSAKRHIFSRPCVSASPSTTMRPRTPRGTRSSFYLGKSTKRRGWRRHKGATSSAGTGPSLAADGDYYMYLEASEYGRGDTVMLYTRKDLRGCFCLHFKHHHNVKKFNKVFNKHRLLVKTQNRILTTRSTPSNKWKDVWLQVDTNRYAMLLIAGIKGADFRGDMAIDDVSIKPGECPRQK